MRGKGPNFGNAHLIRFETVHAKTFLQHGGKAGDRIRVIICHDPRYLSYQKQGSLRDEFFPVLSRVKVDTARDAGFTYLWSVSWEWRNRKENENYIGFRV